MKYLTPKEQLEEKFKNWMHKKYKWSSCCTYASSVRNKCTNYAKFDFFASTNLDEVREKYNSLMEDLEFLELNAYNHANLSNGLKQYVSYLEHLQDISQSQVQNQVQEKEEPLTLRALKDYRDSMGQMGGF